MWRFLIASIDIRLFHPTECLLDGERVRDLVHKTAISGKITRINFHHHDVAQRVFPVGRSGCPAASVIYLPPSVYRQRSWSLHTICHDQHSELEDDIVPVAMKLVTLRVWQSAGALGLLPISLLSSAARHSATKTAEIVVPPSACSARSFTVHAVIQCEVLVSRRSSQGSTEGST